MANLFREAKQLLDKKDAGNQITWDEFQLINTAKIPMDIRGCPFPEDIPLSQGLEELAKMVGGEKVRVTKEEGK